MTFCAKNVLSNSLCSPFILIFFWLYLYRVYYTGKVICLLISTVFRILSRLYYTYFAGRILLPGSFAFTENKRKSFLYYKGDLFICETDGGVYYSRIKYSTRTLSMNTVHVIYLSSVILKNFRPRRALLFSRVNESNFRQVKRGWQSLLLPVDHFSCVVFGTYADTLTPFHPSISRDALNS